MWWSSAKNGWISAYGGVPQFGQTFNFKTKWTHFWISSPKVISNRFETFVERSGVQKGSFWWVSEIKRTTSQKVPAKKRFFLAQIFVARARARPRTFGEGVKIWRYLIWPENGGAEATPSKFFVDPFWIVLILKPVRWNLSHSEEKKTKKWQFQLPT